MNPITENSLGEKFTVKNILRKDPIKDTKSWLGPDKSNGNFVLDFGCFKKINMLELVNTHNENKRDRSTKDFKVYLSDKSPTGPWTEVLNKTLADSRNFKDPLPVQKFSFDGETTRYVKFQMLSFYGFGGGLHYINMRYSGIEH